MRVGGTTRPLPDSLGQIGSDLNPVDVPNAGIDSLCTICSCKWRLLIEVPPPQRSGAGR